MLDRIQKEQAQPLWMPCWHSASTLEVSIELGFSDNDPDLDWDHQQTVLRACCHLKCGWSPPLLGKEHISDILTHSSHHSRLDKQPCWAMVPAMKKHLAVLQIWPASCWMLMGGITQQISVKLTKFPMVEYSNQMKEASASTAVGQPR